MKFLKLRAMAVLIGLITILGSVAIIVSVRVSITLLEKQNQLVKARTDGTGNIAKSVQKPSNTVAFERAEQVPLYFNSEKQEDLVYYTVSEEKAWIPLDIILGKLNMDYTLFNSDDVFKADINGKTLLLRLGSTNAFMDGNAIKLQTPVTAARNHIMVSPEILDFMNGLTTRKYEGDSGVFISYRPPDKKEEIPGLTYILKSGEKTYLIREGSFAQSLVLDVDGASAISLDGKSLYWVDEDRKALYIYDIKSGVTRKLKNYFAEIKTEDGVMPDVYKLLDYQRGKKYTRVNFQGPDPDKIYTVIERNGRIVFDMENKTGTLAGSEMELFNLPWKCDYIYPVPNEGACIALSSEEDSIFYISDGKNEMLGKPSLFPNKSSGGGNDLGFRDNAGLSPDSTKIAVLQAGKAFVELSIVSLADMVRRTFVLDAPDTVGAADTGIKTMWLDNDRLVAYTSDRGWLLDMKDGSSSYAWEENAGNTILGIPLQSQ